MFVLIPSLHVMFPSYCSVPFLPLTQFYWSPSYFSLRSFLKSSSNLQFKLILWIRPSTISQSACVNAKKADFLGRHSSGDAQIVNTSHCCSNLKDFHLPWTQPGTQTIYRRPVNGSQFYISSQDTRPGLPLRGSYESSKIIWDLTCQIRILSIQMAFSF